MTVPRSSIAERQAVNLDVGGAEPPEAAIDRHANLLGMPVATATSRLKKSVYLDLLHRLGEDQCFRCGLSIQNADDLSLDHKKPWRDESSDLFWDLDNVAHSHRSCNKVDRPGRKVGPSGMSWCSTHKDFLPISEFSPGKRWNGLDSNCKACQRERVQRYAALNPRFPCPCCRYGMRKTCQKCGYSLPMKEYMARRRKEGVSY